MKRYRTLIVMTVSVLTAAAATFGVYRAIQTMPIHRVEVDTEPVVVAAATIPVGTRLTKDHLKLVAWPIRTAVPGAFHSTQELIDRGVIATISENEPITARKVAIAGVGAGLPPVIPAGLRAMSVRVNEVIGVAGFVLPGTRVDVLVTVREDGSDSIRQNPMARTVVSNVEVLTAGTRYDQEQAKDGKPQPSTVVTLAVLPADGERIALAAAEGQISLALRNPLDVEPTATSGIKLAALMRGTGPEPVLDVKKERMVPSKRVAPVPPPAAVVPSVYKVEMFRAAKRGEEVVQ
jgi:pilus assembly protein CpaB